MFSLKFFNKTISFLTDIKLSQAADMIDTVINDNLSLGEHFIFIDKMLYKKYKMKSDNLLYVNSFYPNVHAWVDADGDKTKIKIELMLNKTVKWLIIILSVLLLSFQFMILFEKTDNVLISILPLLMLVFAITFPAICFYIQSNSVVKEICKEFSCKKQ